MTIQWIGILLFLFLSTGEGRSAASPLEVVLKQCQLIRITGQFSSTRAKYETAGQCLKYPTQLLWTGQGAYNPTDGLAEEVVDLKGIPPYQGRLTIRVNCSQDPWVDFKRGGLGTPDCWSLRVQAQGEPTVVEPVLTILMSEVQETSKPLSALYRDYVPYQLNQLRAQRDAALKAEAAAVATTNKRLQQGAPRIQPVLGPTIQLGPPGPPFLSNTSVPIKIAPPQGMAVTGYLVRVEIRNAQSQWTLVTNLPVGAAEAHSPSGYLGWGAPGNGRGANMIAGPGAYRVSAQVSAPRSTAWSLPVEFVVTAPSKAIQKAPKMFGP